MYVKGRLLMAALAFSVLAIALGGCKDKKGTNGDPDAALPDGSVDCLAMGFECLSGDECCSGYCDETYGVCAREPGQCIEAGGACQVGPECCSFSCVDGHCSSSQCTSDNELCDSDGQCCSGICTSGSCEALNPTCKTSGNTCSAPEECCSQYCDDGYCSATPSYCVQNGDACTADFECCGGYCPKAEGATLGTCALVPAAGAGGCLSAGEVCGGTYDASNLPVCGGECCSRACLPYAMTGILICQPPSGCRPTGEVCATDLDCCGAVGNPDGDTANVTCSKEGDNPLGRCTQGNACTPAGGICRLQSDSCAANANCCAGNVMQYNTCALDNLGIPRCLAAELDCSTADPADYIGLPCATSADCCDLLPCVSNNDPEFPQFVCGETTCIPEGGSCTTSADCCAPLPCIVPAGSTQGICGEDPGCATWGMTCTLPEDCCEGLPCVDGFCGAPVE
jgi:hypothetical protein